MKATGSASLPLHVPFLSSGRLIPPPAPAYSFSHQRNKPLSPAPVGKQPRQQSPWLGSKGRKNLPKEVGIVSRRERRGADGLSAAPCTHCLFILRSWSYPRTSVSSKFGPFSTQCSPMRLLDSNCGSASKQTLTGLAPLLGKAMCAEPLHRPS